MESEEMGSYDYGSEDVPYLSYSTQLRQQGHYIHPLLPPELRVQRAVSSQDHCRGSSHGLCHSHTV